MEDARVAAVVDDVWIDELDPDLAVHVDRRVRDREGRVRELAVDRGDAGIGAVVEAAIESRHRADSVHHPCPAVRAAREQPQPVEVEVERVEEACTGPWRQDVPLDAHAALLELADDCAERLARASRRRRLELVEEREVGAATPCRERVALDREAPQPTPSRPSHAADALKRDAASTHPAARSTSFPGEWGSTASQLIGGAITPGRAAPEAKRDSPWSAMTSKFSTPSWWTIHLVPWSPARRLIM